MALHEVKMEYFISTNLMIISLFPKSSIQLSKLFNICAQIQKCDQWLSFADHRIFMVMYYLCEINIYLKVLSPQPHPVMGHLGPHTYFSFCSFYCLLLLLSTSCVLTCSMRISYFAARATGVLKNSRVKYSTSH